MIVVNYKDYASLERSGTNAIEKKPFLSLKGRRE